MAMLVRHAMTEAPQTARPDMTAGDAAGLMRQLDVGVVPILEGDSLFGLVTDRDLVIRVLAERRDPDEVKLGDIATKSPVTVTPDTKLAEARELMAEHKVRRLPVVKGAELVGILSLGDVAVAAASDSKTGETLEQISESDATKDISNGPDRGTPERVQRTGTEG
ncbi:MAG: CBS domain-containing protein [Actinomycetota bacterium]